MDMQQPNGPMAAQLTADQWNAVLAAVNELPHRVARPIWDSLMQQLRQQSMPRPMFTEDVERVIPDGA